jgi:hypothetical protein
MHVDDLLWAKNLAAEAGNAVLAEFDDWKQLDLPQTFDLAGDRCGLHVYDVGWADEIANAAAGALLDFDIFDHVIRSTAIVGSSQLKQRAGACTTGF